MTIPKNNDAASFMSSKEISDFRLLPLLDPPIFPKI